MINKAAEIIRNSKNITVFTGAGISVESGIPPFRGKEGLWSKYDPIILDLDYYLSNTDKSWPIIKKLFYDFFASAKSNPAHQILTDWENNNTIQSIITQNIDSLHQKAGSKNVIEFHGTAREFVCSKCTTYYKVSKFFLDNNVPLCKNNNCKGILKPNFIFFGEGIPQEAYEKSIHAATNADLFIIIGTSGEIMPANQIPQIAKEHGSIILEINTKPSLYSNTITDEFLKGQASTILSQLNALLK